MELGRRTLYKFGSLSSYSMYDLARVSSLHILCVYSSYGGYGLRVNGRQTYRCAPILLFLGIYNCRTLPIFIRRVLATNKYGHSSTTALH